MDVKAKLDISRKELLDLTLRNPLLNYRTLKAKGLEIVDEKAEEIYKLLVLDGKGMTFLPAEKRVEAKEAASEEQTAEKLAQTYSDLKIQTNYTESELQSRLLSTHLEAKTVIEERGVNTLFLAVGMLQWKEAASSDKAYMAPLILIPVILERASIQERFVLRYSEEDVQFNVSLAAKMKDEFDISLEYEQEELELPAYIEFIKSRIRAHKEWSIVENHMAIGFFSFSKYLMYLDLDVDKWPENTDIKNNPVINALLQNGFKEPQTAAGDNDFLDPLLNPDKIYHVVDADSSQTLAIMDVNAGRNLVIQGPPGTGKSQTITNIISEAVGQGKKVLFVSEKMAALEVVKRRLTNVGLGDVCLELHSHKAHKKDILKELKRTMELGKPMVGDTESLLEQYVKLRDELNQYCMSINESIAPSKASPVKAHGKLLAIKRIEEEQQKEIPQIQIPQILQWDDKAYQERLDRVAELKAHLSRMGLPAEHPFWGSELRLVLPGKEAAFAKLSRQLKDALSQLTVAVEIIAQKLGIEACQCYQDSERLYNTLSYCAKMPELGGLNRVSPGWYKEADLLQALLQAGAVAAEGYKKHNELFLDNAWEQEVFSIRQSLSPYIGKWWKFLSGTYRKGSRQFGSLLKAPAKLSIEEKVSALDSILAFKKAEKMAADNKSLIDELLGAEYKGISSTNWSKLQEAAAWLKGYYKEAEGKAFYDISVSFSKEECLKSFAAWAEQMAAANQSCKSKLKECCEELKFRGDIRFGKASWEYTTSFAELSGLAEGWSNASSSMSEIAVYNQYSDKLKELGLEGLLKLVAADDSFAELMQTAIEQVRYEALLSKAYQERPVLASFDSAKHKLSIDKFAACDTKLIKHNIERLLYKHWTNLPQQGGNVQGQIGILLREFQKKSRHMPIRRLISAAGNIIQAIKPVMMMSPLSIANFIEPGCLSFDLVVFDEASQVKPVEAFGALMRGKQAVVVGDSQQMPPTNFFDRIMMSEEEEPEEDQANVGDYESILKLFLAQNAPEKTLRWHYRSRHESLIAVSNKEFYDSRLVIFPSVESRQKDIGLIFNYMQNTAYDRGGSRTNKEEAKAVAERVMQHARQTPELTLGVAAFSMAQMTAIINQLEILRRNDPSAEAFFQSHKEEPFFVKNLENLQGDERDVIFISVGYGKTAEGYLAMDFGPLNREGGERRLNVLITRARSRCEVFSNIKGDDIDLGRTSSRGVECLKSFLNYAEKGILDLPKETGREADSDFELEVYHQLSQKGYQVRKQIGCAGFFIDLAIVDPENPGRYLLGIECDGATYHSSKTARDRDRLRQAVLENKGWTIYRIWSTDWFRNHHKELQKLEAFIATLKANKQQSSTITQTETGGIIRKEEQAEQTGAASEIKAYELYHGQVPQEVFEKESLLKEQITRIVAFESPVHRDEVLRRLVTLSGSTRAGARMKAAFDGALDYLVRSNALQLREEFLFDKAGTVTLRSRGDMPTTYKKLDYIAKEELKLAILKVLELSYGMLYEDIPLAAAKLLGFHKTSEEMQLRILSVVDEMEKAGELKKQGENYIR